MRETEKGWERAMKWEQEFYIINKSNIAAKYKAMCICVCVYYMYEYWNWWFTFVLVLHSLGYLFKCEHLLYYIWNVLFFVWGEQKKTRFFSVLWQTFAGNANRRIESLLCPNWRRIERVNPRKDSTCWKTK